MSKRASSDTVIPLDSKKQVTVRKFNNINLVDIREFYVDKVTKEKKPGKKGISLTEDVWHKLMNAQGDIEDALDELKGASSSKKTKISEPPQDDSSQKPPPKSETKSAEVVEDSEASEEE